MRKFDYSKFFKLSVSLVLIAAAALCLFACGNKNETPETGDSKAVTITVTVIDDKGDSKEFILETEKGNLGDALLEAKLVEGEMGQFGLYIKSVNGLRADFELDGAYWSLSKGGEYLMTGADATPIADGEKYELTYTKG